MKHYFQIFILTVLIAGCASYEAEIAFTIKTPTPTPTTSQSDSKSTSIDDAQLLKQTEANTVRASTYSVVDNSNSNPVENSLKENQIKRLVRPGTIGVDNRIPTISGQLNVVTLPLNSTANHTNNQKETSQNLETNEVDALDIGGGINEFVDQPVTVDKENAQSNPSTNISASWYVPWEDIKRTAPPVSAESLVPNTKPDNFTVVDDAGNIPYDSFGAIHESQVKRRVDSRSFDGITIAADLSSSGNAPAKSQSLSKAREIDSLQSLGYIAGGASTQNQSYDRSLSNLTITGMPNNYFREQKISQVHDELIQRPQRTPGTEEYEPVEENPFKFVSQNPLSTFSIDVDTASYSNVRRFVMDNTMPHKDVVRIEELINYFTYDYPQPNDETPFAVYTEVAQSPWNPENKLVHVGLQGKSIPMDDLPNNNLVFLLDVSGSMKNANKLPLVKAAFKMLTNQMRPGDRVAIVTYAGRAGLALPSTSGNQKDKIIEALQRLDAGGSTAGGEGIQLAYKIAQENFVPNGNNRVILATDGDFNVGISDTSELVKLIEEKRKSGIFLTVTGFGTGNLKDEKMENLADKGNGNYAYIDNLMEAKKVFVSEMGGTFFTIAKDVKIQVEFNPAIVKAYRLIGYENRMLQDRDFNDDTKDAGEIGAGHSVTALYEIVTKNSGFELPDVDELKYQEVVMKDDTEFADEMMTVKLRYKKPDEDTSKLISVAVNDNDETNQSENMNFSAAVAQYGMLLRGSSHKGNTCFDQVIAMAKEAKGKDEEGYRAEFIRLVEMTQLLHESQTISKSE